jgi:3-oxoacyl-[acyl-carrier protein] reductase
VDEIISIGSGIATRAEIPGVADYAGTKAAIVGYSEGAVRDLGPRGITVNVIQTRLMDTDMAVPFKEVAPVMFSSLAIQRYGQRMQERSSMDAHRGVQLGKIEPSGSHVQE